MEDDAHHADGAKHEKRYGSAAERLRAPQRMALLEVPRVVDLCLEGIRATRALDVGTGTGIFAEALAARGLQVTGIDPNPGLLEAARRLVPGASFATGTAEKLAFEDGSVDLVMMGHVLHEADDPVAALTEARRAARLRVCVLEWPYVDEDRGPPLAHRLRPSDIEDMARRAGFSAVERRDLSHMQLYRLTP
jgi:SAM-dependent methyltransferase